MHMNASEKLELLTTPIWSLSQLMGYLNIKSRTTGIRVKDRAFKEYDGRVPYGNQYVKRDAVLTLCCTTIEREMEVVNEILQKGEIQNQRRVESTAY